MEKMKVRFMSRCDESITEVIINKSRYDLISWMYDNDFSEGFTCEVVENSPEDISEGY